MTRLWQTTARLVFVLTLGLAGAACAASEAAHRTPADDQHGDGRATADDQRGDSLALSDDRVDDGLAGCADDNVCTVDSVTDGNCYHDPVASQALGCVSPWILDRCNAGTRVAVPCAQLCERYGYNANLGCNETELSCQCTTINGTYTCDAANIDIQACVDGNGGYIAVCRAADYYGTNAPLWQLHSCTAMCAAAGYNLSGGCAAYPGDPTQRTCLCGLQCVPTCTGGLVCDPGTGTCVADNGCTSDYGCGSREACEHGQCTPVECRQDFDCAYCYRCANHQCAYCGGSCGYECD
jgi:hypothetical protein